MRKKGLKFSLQPVTRTSFQCPILETRAHSKQHAGHSSFTTTSFGSTRDKRLKKYTCEKLNANLLKFQTQVSPVFDDFCFTSPDHSQVNTSICNTFSPEASFALSPNKEVNSLITRIAKVNILQMKKQTFKRKLSEKFKRFNFRQRKTELIPLKKNWVTGYLALGMPFVMISLVCNKKRLKHRVGLMLAKFSCIALCIGKMRKYVKKAKIVCAFKTITRYLRYAKLWLAQTRETHKKRLLEICELALNKSVSILMISLFKIRVRLKQIIKIQRWIKKALRARELLFDDLLKMWAEKEIEMFRKIGKKNKANSLSFIRINIVPEGKKLAMIKEKVKEVMKEYSRLKGEYCYTVSNLEDILKKNVFNTQEVFDNLPDRPKIPNIRKFFVKNDIVRLLIHKALTERSSVRARRK